MSASEDRDIANHIAVYGYHPDAQEVRMYYKVTGKNRLRGAIGKHENFTEFITAESPVKAANEVREIRYNRGYEHVSIRKVALGNEA